MRGWKSLVMPGALLALAWATFVLARSAYPWQALFGVATLCAFLFVWRLPDTPHHGKTLPKVHFPGLNGLRFIAAFLVVIHHTEQVKYLSGLDSLWSGKSRWSPFFLRAGDNGVTFFFVLSGFLITYLLMVESRETGTIHLKDFYIRRVLRIWPVYFFLTFLAFFVLPHFKLFYLPAMGDLFDANFLPKFALFLVMWFHAGQFLYPGVFLGGVLWTVSVEEQFYFFWPLLVRGLKTRMVHAMALLVPLMIFLRLRLAEVYYWIDPAASRELLMRLLTLQRYFHYFRIDCMAIGGLGAWLVLQRSPLLKILFFWPSQLILAFALAKCLYLGKNFGAYDDDAYALLFVLVILNIGANARSLVKLENVVWEFLGRISYGLYAYNWIAILVAVNSLQLFAPIRNGNVYLLNIYVYFIAFALVVLFASASYFLMERPFLRLKRSFGSISRVSMADTPAPIRP